MITGYDIGMVSSSTSDVDARQTVDRILDDAVQRTRSQQRQTQMRQLLIAGAASASERVREWKQPQHSAWAIDPLETPHGRATVSIEVAPQLDSNRLRARILVGLDANRASQTL